MIKLTRKKWAIAGIAVLVVGGLTYAFTGPSSEEKALIVAVTRLKAGITQGVNIGEYSRLVAEVATQTSLARPKLDSTKKMLVDVLVARASAAGAIWTATIRTPCNYYFQTRGSAGTHYCSEIHDPMTLLGLATGEEDFEQYLKNDPSSEHLISASLAIVASDADMEIEVLRR